MSAIKKLVKVEIPRDDLYEHRIAAEEVLMEVSGYTLYSTYRYQEKTTIFVQKRAA